MKRPSDFTNNPLIPIKSQTIRKDLNEYIRVCTLGGELNYDHYWDKELKQLT